MNFYKIAVNDKTYYYQSDSIITLQNEVHKKFGSNTPIQTIEEKDIPKTTRVINLKAQVQKTPILEKIEKVNKVNKKELETHTDGTPKKTQVDSVKAAVDYLNNKHSEKRILLTKPIDEYIYTAQIEIYAKREKQYKAMLELFKVNPEAAQYQARLLAINLLA